MPAAQLHISDTTPLGATLVADGATFRCWAPRARAVYVAFVRKSTSEPFEARDELLLVKDADGVWSGFFAGVEPGDAYLYYIVGEGSEGYKRDPYARELGFDQQPLGACIVVQPNGYPWCDADFRPPTFNELVVYQFHFGVFFAEDADGRDMRPHRVCKFLDALGRIRYWADLGINAVLPLPFQEFQTASSLGYNGTDLFCPETDYAVADGELEPYLELANQLLTAKGQAPLELHELSGQLSQLKTFINLCHLYGISVLADVVYNHAGGNFDEQSIYFFDRQPPGDNARSLYFQRAGHAGGLVFDYSEPRVRQLLFDNACTLLEDLHLDGFRYDQVTVIDDNGGWSFCQELTRRVRAGKPQAVQIAEYWGREPWRAVTPPPAGMGFDMGYSDVLRSAVRRVIAQAAGGSDTALDLDGLRDALYSTLHLPGRWSSLQCLENHDLIYDNHADKQPRIARLADPSNARSWYARSRARVATALLLTAPGVPLLFMGQEFLEDKPWTDWQGKPELLLWWAGLEGQDRAMLDHYRCTRALIELRRAQPALVADGLNVFHVHQQNRILAFQRWVPGEGRDVVVVVSLSEFTHYDASYLLGFPEAGYWRELFNSDVFDGYVNPNAQGNRGGVMAAAEPLHGMPASAGITIPANSVLVFGRG